MRKCISLLSLLLLSVIASYAQQQNGSIRGTITTSDGRPAANITVRIERSKWGGISDENGQYTIKQIKPGSWTLKVTSVSATTQTKTVTVAANEEAVADFMLDEHSAQLEE